MSIAGHTEAGSATVALIAKEPLAGRVKTRLVPPLKAEEAADVAAASLTDTIAAVDAAAALGLLHRRVLFFEGDPRVFTPEPDCDRGDEPWEVIQQCGGSLGVRLDALFSVLDEPAVVVGMDTPQLRAESIGAALERLVAPGVDAVVGPATDGGYWTIGFNRHVPGAFAGVPMSRDDTCEVQLRRLHELGLSVEILPEMTDIDTFEDALEVTGRNPELTTSGVVRRVCDRLASVAESGPGP